MSCFVLSPVFGVYSVLASEKDCLAHSSTIETKLQCLPEIHFKKASSSKLPKGLQGFDLTVTQPIDHRYPNGEKFHQHLFLLHRDTNRPVVLSTDGYTLGYKEDTQISERFLTNLVKVEHRFFGNSVPSPLDVRYLNIRQSAADFHRITVLLKKIYTHHWVGTGASKGGMASIYHHYYYPNDVDGTLAIVAPNFYNPKDQRSIQFLKHVGGDRYRTCRKNLSLLQQDLLKNRHLYLSLMKESEYQYIGKSAAFEHTVIYLPFRFWAVTSPEDPKYGCSAIPLNGTAAEKFDFLSQNAIIEWQADAHLKETWPYYYQVMTEVGFADQYTAHFEPFRLFDFSIALYVPNFIKLPAFSAKISREVDHWVRAKAKNLLMLYGEYDPMSAAAFRPPQSRQAQMVASLFVKGNNHLTDLKSLKGTQKRLTFTWLKRWLGLNSHQP